MQSGQYRYVSIICITGMCLACAGEPVEPTRIDQCIVGKQCVVEGQLVATSGVGRIEDETGCLAVALPEYATNDWDSRKVRASGEIYRAPDLPGLVTYKVRDREIDAESCYSGLAMYVEKIEQLRHQE